MAIFSVAAGLNVYNDSYRKLFADYSVMAISVIITGVFVFILNIS